MTEETLDVVDKEELKDSGLEEQGRTHLLEMRNVKTYFFTEEGIVKAVDGVSFDMYEDETLGLVGETGCGKSVTALSILQLVRAPGKILEGSVIFKGEDLLKLSVKEMRNYRGNKITMIFQDPLNSLNPVISVGKQISEVFHLHQKEELKQILDDKLLERKINKQKINDLKSKLKKERLTEEEIIEIREEIKELKEATYHLPNINDVALELSANIISEVGIADAEGILKRYPHELSGGMRQRVMI
ncbi:MAG: ATP-binding cassette domain-containing protein, partial [Promethearchaeota archaeon]